MTTHWLEGDSTAQIEKPYILLSSPSIIRLTCRMFNIQFPVAPAQVITICTLPGYRQGTIIGYKDYGSVWTLATQVEDLVINVPPYGGHTFDLGAQIYINFECDNGQPVTQRTIMQRCLIEEIV